MPRIKKSSPSKKKATKKNYIKKKKATAVIAAENDCHVSKHIPLKDIVTNEHFLVRTTSTPIKPLAENMKKNGQLAPILVRPTQNGKYEILFGHRRYDAAKSIKVKTILAIVREDLMNDDDALKVTLHENIQRDDLSSLDQANLCLRLQNEGKHIQEIAKLVFPKQCGKTAEQTVYNYLTIANSDTRIHEALGKRRLQFTNALYLANRLKKREFQSALNSGNLQDVIDEIARNKMSTRECEKMIKELLGTSSNGKVQKRRRSISEPVLFKEGRNGNWTLKVNFNTSKCDNDLDLAVKIKSTLEFALNSIINFLDDKTY